MGMSHPFPQNMDPRTFSKSRINAAGFRGFLQQHLKEAREAGFYPLIDINADVFARGVGQSLHLVEHTVIEFLDNRQDGFLDIGKIDHPAHLGILFAHQANGEEKTVAMQTPAGMRFRKFRQKAGAFKTKLMFELEFHGRSPGVGHTTLHLYKQNFKFSAAHFLIFDEKRAEKLHGHNYQVRVDLRVPDTAGSLEERGYFIDFRHFKDFIRSRLEAWDEMVLLPARHPEMKTREEGPSLHVHFRDRYYVFPRSEVHLLPVTNTSVEQLSRLLAEEFLDAFESVGEVRVRVEETRGQAASFIARRD